MQAQIVNFLKRREGYVSGEEISARLKISRQALWKHIQEFRNLGYDIVAVPHLGYRIISSPDRLFPWEVSYLLNTKFIGRSIYYFDTVSSTMDVAFEFGITKEASEGALFLAETQLKGKGRLGRHWNSPRYKGIYLSLILRPKILPNESPILTLIVSVSVSEAIKECVGLEAKIKWPNDILMQNKKVGGILTEINAEMDAIHFVVIGIGLNVNNDRKTLPAQATSLKEQKNEGINRVELLQEILRKIEANYLLFQKEGSQPILEKWRCCNLTLGKRVRVLFYKRHLDGEAVDIDKDGGLLIRGDSGLIQKVSAGEITHCK